MGGMTDYLEAQLLNYLRGTAPTVPSTIYVSLHTADPGDDASAAEVSGNGYARQLITFNLPIGDTGTMTNLRAAVFSASGGNWGTITHFALWDSVTSGNSLHHGKMLDEPVINDGETYRIVSGTLQVRLK